MVWPKMSILKSIVRDSNKTDVMVFRSNKFLLKTQLPIKLLEACL